MTRRTGPEGRSGPGVQAARKGRKAAGPTLSPEGGRTGRTEEIVDKTERKDAFAQNREGLRQRRRRSHGERLRQNGSGELQAELHGAGLPRRGGRVIGVTRVGGACAVNIG